MFNIFLFDFGFLVSQISKEVRSVGPLLAPFLKTACIYFILDLPEGAPSLTATVVKCLPIMALMMFVWAQGTQDNPYNTRILLGLGLSCVGDALLVWQQRDMAFFLVGMLSFSCAQVAYMSAFGFHPFGLKELLMTAAITVPTQAVVLACVPTVLLLPVFIYVQLLCIVLWRALARFNLRGEIPWRKIYAAVGMLLFTASDFLLGVNKFCHPLPYQDTLIMSGYYAAQMCVALSVMNSRLAYEAFSSSPLLSSPPSSPLSSTSFTQ